MQSYCMELDMIINNINKMESCLIHICTYEKMAHLNIHVSMFRNLEMHKQS